MASSITRSMINLYFVGTAGSGKSTMVHAFQQWMNMNGLDCITVNLDPGAEDIPYEPDVDIRDWVKLDEVMSQYGLGPNGAQIAAADMMAMNAADLKAAVEGFKSPYVLIDTPGQIELFAFRRSSEVIMDALGREDSFLIFLADPGLAKTPSGFVSCMMLAATTHFRFDAPFLVVLSKADMLQDEELERVLEWSRDADALNYDLGKARGSRTLLSLEIFKAMEGIGVYREATPVSSSEGEGMEDIYAAVQMAFEGGDDLRPD
jgi:GTPase SAR1 family protein